MVKVKPKTVNSLMKYMRDSLNIDINGSKEKLQLRNYGYYHSVKGFRFVKYRTNPINYSTFNELEQVYTFDQKVKALFYPHMMFIETAIKNRVLEELLKESESDSFSYIYENYLNFYKTHTTGSRNHTKALNKRLNLRNKIYGTLSYQYSKRHKIPQHFYNNDVNVPIWAIFELISMGELGNLISTMNQNIKIELGKSLGINVAFNSNGKLSEDIVFLLKDLRNSLAHNNVVFDNRFQTSRVGTQFITCLQSETGVVGIDFLTIVDYFILMIYVRKNLGETKTNLSKSITEFQNSIDTLRGVVPTPIYSQFIHTNTRTKLSSLRSYI